jgi:hypothetical protein
LPWVWKILATLALEFLLTNTECAMNRRKFMKQGLVAGVVASRALPLDAKKAFAAEAPAGVGRSVTLAAKPTQISLDLAKTVVMVVDMQNDFASKGGMFDRAGFDISIVQRAVPTTAKVLAAARSAGIKIVSEDGIPAGPLRHGSAGFLELDRSPRGWRRDGGAYA